MTDAERTRGLLVSAVAVALLLRDPQNSTALEAIKKSQEFVDALECAIGPIGCLLEDK